MPGGGAQFGWIVAVAPQALHRVVFPGGSDVLYRSSRFLALADDSAASVIVVPRSEWAFHRVVGPGQV